MKKGIQIKQFCISSRQKLWRKLLVMSRSSLSFQLAVLLPLFILTVIVFFFGFFGLDTSQNCSIYPPSWNEILIYVTVVFWKVYHELYFDWHCSPCITLLFITLWSATVTLTIKMSKLGNSSSKVETGYNIPVAKLTKNWSQGFYNCMCLVHFQFPISTEGCLVEVLIVPMKTSFMQGYHGQT